MPADGSSLGAEVWSAFSRSGTKIHQASWLALVYGRDLRAGRQAMDLPLPSRGRSGPGRDMLLREKRDVASVKAFFAQAIKRRGVVPDEVVTDKHRAYLRVVRQHAPNAKHRRTGLHRQRALTTKPIERSHVPIKDRVRPMRGLGSVATGQHLLEGVELAQAVKRGDVRSPNQREASSIHEGVRLDVITFSWLATGLRTAA